MIASVQEQPLLRIFDDPGKAFLQVGAGHGAAAQDVPAMGPDGLEPQALWMSACDGKLPGGEQLT
jgi:hypothetical protein